MCVCHIVRQFVGLWGGGGGDVISQLDGYFLGMENRIREYIDRGKFILNLGY